MNRILFKASEIENGLARFSDERAEHVLKILHGEVGQTLKTGEIDGLIGTSEIVAIEKGVVTVRTNHTEKSLAPWIDLVLAPPRPRVMKRLLPQLATMGVGKIVLVGAKKVEKDFWGATLLKESSYRPLLVEGLMQGGSSTLPTLETRRNFRAFVRGELDAMFPTTNRTLAHPYVESKGASSEKGRPLLAIGPEGGWTDEEVSLMVEHGFRAFSLGRRILKTETATVAALSRLMEAYDE